MDDRQLLVYSHNTFPKINVHCWFLPKSQIYGFLNQIQDNQIQRDRVHHTIHRVPIAQVLFLRRYFQFHISAI